MNSLESRFCVFSDPLEFVFNPLFLRLRRGELGDIEPKITRVRVAISKQESLDILDSDNRRLVLQIETRVVDFPDEVCKLHITINRNINKYYLWCRVGSRGLPSVVCLGGPSGRPWWWTLLVY